MKVQREAQNLLLLGGSIGNFFSPGRTKQGAGARQESKAQSFPPKPPKLGAPRSFRGTKILLTRNPWSPKLGKTLDSREATSETPNASKARIPYCEEETALFSTTGDKFLIQPEKNNDISAGKEGSKNKSRTRQAPTDLSEDSDHPKTMRGGTT
jgi:hypothetical protein